MSQGGGNEGGGRWAGAGMGRTGREGRQNSVMKYNFVSEVSGTSLHTPCQQLGPQPSTPSTPSHLPSRTRTFGSDGSSRPRWRKIGIFLGFHCIYFLISFPLSSYGEHSPWPSRSEVSVCLHLFLSAARALSTCESLLAS